MNLVESLRRAREGKLFKGLTFYITAKPKTDRDIVKQIIECHGGLVRSPFPSSLDADNSPLPRRCTSPRCPRARRWPRGSKHT